MERVVVENDIQPVAVALVIRGKDLILDPSIYSIEAEMQVKRALVREKELREAGDEAGALELMIDLLADIVLPHNPDWDHEELRNSITSQQVGWAFGFFEVMSPSGGRVPKEAMQKVADVLSGKTTGETSPNGTPKTPVTPIRRSRTRESERSAGRS